MNLLYLNKLVVKPIKQLYAIVTFCNINFYIFPICLLLTTHQVSMANEGKNTYVSSISWQGVSQEEKKKLLSQIALQIETPLTLPILQEAITTIQTYFLAQGYANVKVVVDKNCDSFKKGKVCFQVKKGNKMYVRKLFFEGNKHLDNKSLQYFLSHTRQKINSFTDLKEVLVQHLHHWAPLAAARDLWYFFKDTPFIEANLAKEVTYLKQYYQNKGFIEIDISYELTKRKNYIDVLFKIKEGPQYKIGRIEWKGNHLFTSQKLNKLLDIKTGDSYNPAYLQKRLDPNLLTSGINSFYEKKGYFLATCKVSIIRIQAACVDLEIVLEEKPLLKINKIRINKAAQIREDILHGILRQNGIEQGKKITRAKLQACYNNMATSGLFVPEKIQFTFEQVSATSVDLICNFTPRPAMAGLHGEVDWPNLRGGCYISNFDWEKLLQGKKPVGGGQNLSLDFQTNIYKLFSSQQLNGIFSFEFPWIFWDKDPNTLKVSIFNLSQKQDKYIELEKGASIYFGKKWNKLDYRHKWKMGLTYSTKNLQNFGSLTKFALYSNHISKIVLHGTYSRDSSNDLLYPTYGNIVALQLKKSFDISKAPYSLNANYWQITGNYTEFNKLFLSPSLYSFIVKYACSAGLAGTSNDKESSLGRFFLGGNPTKNVYDPLDSYYEPVRGYGDGVIMPLQGKRKHAGGLCYLTQNIELRYPFGKPTHSYGLFFIDAGCNGVAAEEPFAWALSCGLGTRTQTPLGVLRVDVAWPLVGKKNWAPKLHFYLGTKF